jgi:hypothetical protein
MALACQTWHLSQMRRCFTLQIIRTLRILAYGRRKIPIQPMKFPSTLIRLMCDVQCLVVGLFGPFSSKTLLTWSSTLTPSMKFLGQLNEEKIAEVQSQQDSATYRTARVTMCRVSFLFGDLIISTGLWPPRSLWFVDTRFIFYGENSYCSDPSIWDELKTDISNIIFCISPLKLQSMSTNVLRRARLYMQLSGEHSQNFFKNMQTP